MLDTTIDDGKRPTAAAGAMARSIASQKHDAGSNLPMVYVTRYCALEAASLAAAVRDALAALDAYAARHPEAKYGPPVATYRNKRGTTVTLDVGLPLDRQPMAPMTGEFHLGEAPAALPLPHRGQDSFGQALRIGGELSVASAWQLPWANRGAKALFATTH